MAFPRATSEERRERSELDARYGKIGISAVAAAVRYQGERHGPDAAPRQDRKHAADESAARTRQARRA